MNAPETFLEARSAPALLFAHAASRGADTALRYKHLGLWRDISFAAYAQAVREAAAGFIALGLEAGARVAVIGENRREWLITDLAAQAAGGVTVGIYTTNAAKECAYILGHSDARIFVVENEEQLDKALETRDELPALKWIVVMDMKGLHDFSDPMVISWTDLLARGRAHEAAAPGVIEARIAALDAQATAILIYTSGTTGPPKGAMLSHRNIVWTARQLVDVFASHDEEDVVSFLPLSHIAERLLSSYLALTAGYRVHFVENVDAVTQNITEVSPTLLFAVPRIWEKYQSMILIRVKDGHWTKRAAFAAAYYLGRAYARARLDSGRPVPLHLRLGFALANLLVLAKLRKRLGFDRVRTAVSGAAAISPDVLRFYHALGVPLRQIYGQTEGSGPTSCHRGDIIDPANAGPPLPGVEVRIAADGEILVRGANVFQGYYRNPEATAETVTDGWLHSGDVGELDARGFLKITDRKKDLLITSGGKNVAPQPIENELKTSLYITDAILIGDGRNFITALIVIDEENVLKFAQDRKVQYTTYASLTETREVRELILAEVRRTNAGLARVEQIKRFTILPKKLLEEDGEVTPTMKVKRRAINRQFAELIEGMYRGEEGVGV
ncbi:MAG: long-chain fatty acid--CoA ligase [Betaproteobacteria bacterium]|nr:long-chain fatty acid--CoA ligase [Betaproteobacteria bacterium]